MRLISTVAEASNGCAEVSAWIVPELLHQRMSIERRLHDGPLHAAAASVHETHFAKSSGHRRTYVFFDDRRNIPRRERMEVDLGSNRHYVHDIDSSEFRVQIADCGRVPVARLNSEL